MFDNIVYLNRDIDTDRRALIEGQLSAHNIEAVRFAAIESGLQELIHQPLNELRMVFAQASCLISHLEIIRAYGDKDLLVFEDDIDLSTSLYWGTSFKDIVDCIDESVGIVQLTSFPSPIPVKPIKWVQGTFGTGAYLIRSWYAKSLVEKAFKDGKWDISLLESKYVQPLADSILYSNGPSISVTLFGLKPIKSTILPHATYVETADMFGNSWKNGLNNTDSIKASLRLIKC